MIFKTRTGNNIMTLIMLGTQALKGWPVIGSLLSVCENLQSPFQNSQMLGGY